MDIFTNYLEQVYAPNNTQTNYTAGMNAMVDAINRNFAKIMSEPILRGEKGTSVRTETLPMWVLSGTSWKLTAIGAAIMNTIYGPASQHASDMMVGGSSIVSFTPFNEGDDAINIFPDAPGFINLQTRPALVEDRFYTINEQTQQRQNLTYNSWEFINPLSNYNQDLISRGVRNERLYVRCFVTDETRSRTRRFFTNMYVFYDARIPQLETVYNDYIGRPRPSNPSMNSQFEIWFDRSCSIYGSIDETNTLGWQCEYYTITPKLYWQSDIERFCWQINDVRTGVSAQGLRGPAGSNASMCVGCGVLDPPVPQSPTRCTINYVLNNSIDSGGAPISSWVGVNAAPPEEGSLAIVFSCSNDLQLPTPIDPATMPYGIVNDVLFGVIHQYNGVYYVDYFANSGIAGIYMSILSSLFNMVGYTARATSPQLRRGYVLRHEDVSNPINTSEICAMLWAGKRRGPLKKDVFLGNVDFASTDQQQLPPEVSMFGPYTEKNAFHVGFNTNITGNIYVHGDSGARFLDTDYTPGTNKIYARGVGTDSDLNIIGILSSGSSLEGNNRLQSLNGRTIVNDNPNNEKYTYPSRRNANTIITDGSLPTLNVKTDKTATNNNKAPSGAITASVGRYTDVFVGCPIGTIIMYAGLLNFETNNSLYTQPKTAKRIIDYNYNLNGVTTDLVFVEKDWVLCNGVCLKPDDIDGIFSKLKEIGALRRDSYIPDLTLRFPAGAYYVGGSGNTQTSALPDDRKYLHSVGGEELHKLKASEVGIYGIQQRSGIDISTVVGRQTLAKTQYMIPVGNYVNNGDIHTNQTDAFLNTEPHNNLPPFYTVNFIMKYR